MDISISGARLTGMSSDRNNVLVAVEGANPIISIDGVLVALAVALAAGGATGGSIPLLGSYASELAIKLHDHEQVVNGVLINTDTGKPVFPAVAVAAAPKRVKNDSSHDGIAALQQFKQDNNLFKPGFTIDGNPKAVDFPGDTEPRLRYSSMIETGWLVLEDESAKSVAAKPAPVTVVPANTERGQIVLMHGWSKSAMQVATTGLDRQEVLNYLDVPADAPITKSVNDLARLKVVQVGGNNFRVNSKFVRDGKVETDWDPLPSTTLDFLVAIGGDVACDLRLKPGEKNVLLLRNEDGGTDLLLIWTPPK